MNFIWTNSSVAEVTKGISNCNTLWQAVQVTIDSRTARKGDLFIALQGERSDGHEFIEAAKNQGAIAALVQEFVQSDLPQIKVASTRTALQELGIYNRARSKAKIIGVTGSVGKTSTKEALRIAFTSQGSTYASHGNFNNDLGVPISLSNIPLDTRFAIFEMGMSAHGELTELTKQVRPHIAIISNIEPVHLEFFSSLKDIAKAKAEIFTGVEDGGFAILNKDNDLFTYLAELATASNIKNVLSFGEDEKADARLISYTESEHSCLIKADILGKIISYRLGCSGIHQARNSLAVLLAVAAAEEDIVSSAETLQEFSALKGRGKIYNLAKNNLEYFLIDDSYNAGPASIKAALKVLGTCQAKTGRRVAILADMRELGPSSVEFHKDLATDIINNNIDQVICVGNMMRHLYDILPQNKKLAAFANVNEVIPEIYHYLKNKDMVLVKGSLGTGIFKLVEHLIK